jgi:hypothetical protein
LCHFPHPSLFLFLQLESFVYPSSFSYNSSARPNDLSYNSHFSITVNMSAPRAYQFIALRRLATGGSRRQLHMTGPATFPSPLLTAERPVSNFPRDIAGLRAECKRRKLDFSGSMHDVSFTNVVDIMLHKTDKNTACGPSVCR